MGPAQPGSLLTAIDDLVRARHQDVPMTVEYASVGPEDEATPRTTTDDHLHRLDVDALLADLMTGLNRPGP